MHPMFFVPRGDDLAGGQIPHPNGLLGELLWRDNIGRDTAVSLVLLAICRHIVGV